MAKFINDLLDLYANGDLTDDDLLQWTENRRRLEEYHADVQQHRLREKMKRKQDESIRLGLSPETIVIRREEEEKILHFFSWIQSILLPDEWELWSQYITRRRLTLRELGERIGVTPQMVSYKVKRVTEKVRMLLPYYTEQFGDLKEYLEG